ncbi:hypothetical protein AAG570_003331 [Ranatra chinensis]|uniref:FHF complex subunit HOOK-interacting protein C-terminal domain-containing protein n=1 Tax=Ranatra chinensis TaxID=642074 RepID=A0ABD0YKQ6_9HEMI
MLAKFSTVLQNAVDALAPPAPPHEDFAYHWKKLMKHYLDVSTTKQVPIELTNIPAHFDQLLKILLKEDEEADEATTGPCLEYLLQHNLLDLLVTLANSDDPPGMRQYVLQFITRLLTHLKTPIAAHTNVYPPLQRLVSMCDGSTPTATEGDEVNFLFGLTALLRCHPQVIPVFTFQGESSKCELRRNSCSSDASSQFSVLTSTSDLMLPSTPPVNNALFANIQPSASPSSALLPGQSSAASRPPHLVPVPPPQPPLQAEEGYDSGGEDAASGANCTVTADQCTNGGSVDSTSSDDGFPVLDSLLSYLETADSRIRLKVCQSVMLLVSVPEDRVATTVTSESALCSRLAQRLADLCREIPDSTEPNHIDDMNVRWGLDSPTSPCVSCEGCRQVASFLSWFDFCNQIMVESHSTIGEALRRAIYERFLESTLTPDSLTRVLTLTLATKCFKLTTSPKLNSVLCEWVVGGEIDGCRKAVDTDSVLGTLFNNWKSTNSELALETLRFFEVLLEKGNDCLMDRLLYVYLNDRGYIGSETAIDSTGDSQATRLDGIIQSFLTVMPVELRSGACEPNSAGYEQYVSESHRQYAAVAAAATRLPPSPPPPGSDATQFFEGPFLSTLLGSIRNIPNQEYEINLQLTAVVSRLALCAHPCVDEFLLDTTVTLRDGVVSLHGALREVAAVLAAAVTPRPGYRQRLAHTRARLLGADLTAHSGDEWSSALECVVVIDELCKELAAIAYVKHKHDPSSCVVSPAEES